MQSIKDDTQSGFDAQIAEHRTMPGRCRVTLAQFDDQYDVVYAGRDLSAFTDDERAAATE